MVLPEVDCISVLLHTLDCSPLLLTDTFRTSQRRSNTWQCHILASVLTCLAPRIRAEVIDFRLCRSHGELDRDACAAVQIAAQDVCHAVRQAETFLRACEMDDPAALIVSTACTGQALTVHVHNIFWCVSGFLLATRLAIGLSDDKLSTIIQQQSHCYTHIISRYTGLGAEVLDHKDFASTTQLSGGIFALTSSSPAASIAKILSCRLNWLLSRDRTREQQADILLEDLKINVDELQLENSIRLDEGSDERLSLARASWVGIPVSVRPCHRSYLKEHAKLMLRMKNPFVLQFLGWAEVMTDKGLACLLLMEDAETDLESLTREKAKSRTGIEKEMVSPFLFSVALDMMLQIARGMWYLHRNGVAHTCLQSPNVLVCSKNDEGPTSLKLSFGGVSAHAQGPSLLDFATDILDFGMLCREMLTGRKPSPAAEVPEDFQLPASTPLLLSDCLKACCDLKPENRPEFAVICGLLRQFKLIATHPRRLERLLYLNEAAKESSNPLLTDSIFLSSKGAYKAAPDKTNFRAQLVEINVHLLHASSPRDIYPFIAMEACLAKPLISLNTLTDISFNFNQSLEISQNHGRSSSTDQPQFVVANSGTLKTLLVVDGCQGLLKSDWTSTILGVGTLEMWLKYISPAWKDIQKVALGMALCLRHVSKTPPRLGFYSQENGSIVGFYPIHPYNILLNSQLKVALLLDSSPPAWKSLTQWAGVHPHVGEDANNTLISIEAYTTFYFGQLLSHILKSRLSKAEKSTVGHLDRQFEIMLTNLAMRCIQLRYLSMAEVVTLLLGDCNLVHHDLN